MPRPKDLPKIILASSSPRRIELLSQLGLRPRVIRPDVDESPRSGEAPRKMVARLAREKALSVAGRRDARSAWVIAADTIVVAPDGRTVLGKPTGAREARSMLRSLAGRTHTVFTAYCIAGGGRTHVRVVRTRVKMRALSSFEISRYVATGEPMDKAGSYAAQGLGMAIVERVSGNYTNVVGLPIAQLVSDLETRFGLELFSWKR